MHVNPLASFCTAKWNIHDGSFPRHQRRQRSHVVQIYRRMIPETTFIRSTAVIMLHAIGVEGRYLAIVSQYGKLDRYFTFGCEKQLLETFWVFKVL
jgi:hypothetical protein